MSGTLYALITSHCNLSCPYCDVKNCKEEFNRDLFIDQLNKFDGRIILFGGEPTMYMDRLLDIYINNPALTRKISSISTNLISLNPKLLSILQFIRYIATSWNPDRFNGNEYQQWLDNIKLIQEEIPTVEIRVLVTMTDELLKLSAEEFNGVIAEWNCPVIKDIKFEHCIGINSNKEYMNKCDEWLCNVYKTWESPITMVNIKEMKNWYHDCRDVYSLHPDGSITKGCPHAADIVVPEECYTCERNDVCKPCQLQKYCSYPFKFAELVKEK